MFMKSTLAANLPETRCCAKFMFLTRDLNAGAGCKPGLRPSSGFEKTQENAMIYCINLTGANLDYVWRVVQIIHCAHKHVFKGRDYESRFPAKNELRQKRSFTPYICNIDII